MEQVTGFSARADWRRRILASHAFFRDLPTATLDRLASYAHSSLCSKGHAIFRKGEEGAGLLAVVRGTVRISVLSEEGKEIVLNLIGPGEIFGEIALLDGGPRTADAVAVTDAELFGLDRREFASFVLAEPKAALKILEVLARRLRRTSAQVEDLTFSKAAARLAKAILSLSAGALAPNTIHVTQRELGQMAGLSRESTNKQLREWEAKGFLSVYKGELRVIDPDALRRTSGA